MARAAHSYWVHSNPDAPDDGDVQRVCARGEHCAGATVTDLGDGTSRRDPAPCYRSLCDADWGHVEHDLAELPYLYAHLAVDLRSPARRGTPVRVPAGSRVPLRVDVDALMRAITESLVSWHERVAVAVSLSFPEGGRRDGWAVSRAVRVLQPRLTTLLGLEAEPMRRAYDLRDLDALPDDALGVVHSVYAEVNVDLSGGDAGLEILNLRHLARSVLGETKAKPEELLGVPCRVDDCDMLALRRAELPSDPASPVWWSECAVCGDRMTEEEYREWTKRYARWAQGRTLPVLENLPSVS